MVYVISFLAVAAVPLAVAGYGGHLAAKVLNPPERRKALSIVWALAALGVLLSGLQQVLVYRSDRARESAQVALEIRAEQDQKQLREKLDSSLRRQDDVRTQLDGIVRYLRTPPPRMNARQVADAASTMVKKAMHAD